MATFAEIKARVQVAVIDLPTAVNSAVGKLVNVAMRRLQDRHNFWVMRAAQSYTTTLNTRSLGATPSDFKGFRERPYWITFTDGKVHFIETAPSAQGPLGAINDQDTGFPLFVARSNPSNETGASTMDVYPLPDGLSDYSNGEYRLVVPYWKYLSDLSADGSTNWFTVNAEEFLFKRAVAEGFGLDWDAENMALWMQRAEDEINLIIKEDRKQMLTSVSTLVPHYQGVNSPLVRW